MRKWFIISKAETNLKANYPIYVIQRKLGSTIIPYRSAKSISLNGANIILHCVWKKQQYTEWRNIFETLKSANKVWLEFDADNHLDSLYELDQPKDDARFFYKIFSSINNFIWEQPMFYNPFGRDIERIQLRFYDPRFQKPINRDRDIDFFTCIDTNKNLLESMELFTRLHKDGKKICFMILNKDLYNYYKDRLDFKIITNSTKFSASSVDRFEELMKRSKVYIDLSYRLTTGRVVYDAIYNGAYFAGTNTYGATDILFPEYSVTPYPINLESIYTKAYEALGNWSLNNVEHKRAYLREHASVENFIKELKERSE